MIVFIDFEASSLGKRSYPIEVAWVFEDGTHESHLIRPAPGWDDWDAAAQAIHRIDRATLLQDGTPHDEVARRMVTQLSDHDLTASAPSWDGKWLSALLRAAGLPRHSLRLRDTEAAQLDIAVKILRDRFSGDQLARTAERVRAEAVAARMGGRPAHRALADAQEERARWLAVRKMAEQACAGAPNDMAG